MTKPTLHTIDATGRSAGRIATQVAMILMGKHTAQYQPHIMTVDSVHIINSSKMKFTGKKLDGKIFYHHSKYPGGLKERTLRTVMGKDPTFAIRHAIERMLPKNNTRPKLMKKLRISA